MPLPIDGRPPAAPEPGRYKQLKLHEMALSYAGALHERLCLLAAELAAELGSRMHQDGWDGVAWIRYFRYSLGEALRSVLAEQRGGSASPFVEAVCAAFDEDISRAGFASVSLWESRANDFRSFAEFLAERRTAAPAGDPAHLAAAAELVGGRVGELLALADLREVEDVCEELLTGIFHWDGRRFVISGERAVQAQGLIDRCLAGGRWSEEADNPAAAKDLCKLALVMIHLWRKPAPGLSARLKEGYVVLGTRSQPAARSGGLIARDGRGSSRPGELAEEIEAFCRTLMVLRGMAERTPGG